jgi:hypothetical protein
VESFKKKSILIKKFMKNTEKIIPTITLTIENENV